MLFKKHFSSVGQDMELLKYFFLSDLFFEIFNNNSIIFFTSDIETEVCLSCQLQFKAQQNDQSGFVIFADTKNASMIFYDCKISLIFFYFYVGVWISFWQRCILEENGFEFETDLVMSSFELGNLCWIIKILVNDLNFI